jgi:hypothetical protein
VLLGPAAELQGVPSDGMPAAFVTQAGARRFVVLKTL